MQIVVNYEKFDFYRIISIYNITTVMQEYDTIYQYSFLSWNVSAFFNMLVSKKMLKSRAPGSHKII